MALPKGFLVFGISVDPSGKIFLSGSLEDSNVDNGKRKGVLAVVEDSELRWVELAFSLRDRVRLWLAGSGEQFDSVDAAGAPTVIATDHYTLRDGDNWPPEHAIFLVEDEPRWHTAIQRNCILRIAREKPEQLSIYDADGVRHRTCDRGISWTRDDLVPAIRAAAIASAPSRPTIGAVYADSGCLLLAVGFPEPGQDEREVRIRHILSSCDDGMSFLLRASVSASHAEICALHVL